MDLNVHLDNFKDDVRNEIGIRCKVQRHSLFNKTETQESTGLSAQSGVKGWPAKEGPPYGQQVGNKPACFEDTSSRPTRTV